MRRIFLILICVLFVAACSDVVTSRYDTYEDADSDQLFERGWLPELIPESSFNIITANNLDRNTSTGEFHYRAADTASFTRQLNSYDGRLAPFVDHDEYIAKRMGQGYAPYQFIDDAFVWVFLVDAKNGHAYYIFWVERISG